MNDVFPYRVVDGFWNEQRLRRELKRPKVWVFSQPPPDFNPIVTIPDTEGAEEWFDGAIQTYSDAKSMWPVWAITKFPLGLPVELKGVAV